MARRQVSIEGIAGKRRWTADDAQVVLDAAERSGLTLGAFASVQGLDPQRLYRWSRQLAERGSPHEYVAFAEMALDRTVIAHAGGTSLEVVLRSGHVIRVGTDFDASTLRRLVAVLEEREEC